jgi:Glycosyl transferase family 2
MNLVSHINADGDILQAWLDHYVRLGVTRFHVVLHGPEEENAALLALRDLYPIEVHEMYGGPFLGGEKKRRLDRVLAELTGQWLLLVDSDEFLELPVGSMAEAIRLLDRTGTDALAAPMVQRLRADGSLESPDLVSDPFREFPLCSWNLYSHMSVKAPLSKFPLFYCRSGTEMMESGNYYPPLGTVAVPDILRGVSHHFKWRRVVLERLRRRADSNERTGEDSAGFLGYLERNGRRLPIQDAFPGTRDELERRRLLRRPRPAQVLAARLRRATRTLPPGVQDVLGRVYRTLRRR